MIKTMSNAQLSESLGRLDKALKSMQTDYTGLKSQFKEFQKATTSAQKGMQTTLKSISDMMTTFSKRMDDLGNIVESEQTVDANGNDLLLGLQKDMNALKEMMGQLQVQESQQDAQVESIMESDAILLDSTKVIKRQQSELERLSTEVRNIAEKTNQSVMSQPSSLLNTVLLILIILGIGAFLYYFVKKP